MGADGRGRDGDADRLVRLQYIRGRGRYGDDHRASVDELHSVRSCVVAGRADQSIERRLPRDQRGGGQQRRAVDGEEIVDEILEARRVAAAKIVSPRVIGEDEPNLGGQIPYDRIVDGQAVRRRVADSSPIAHDLDAQSATIRPYHERR